MAVVVSLTKDKILSLIPSMEDMIEWLEDNVEIVDPQQFEDLRLLLEQTRQELAQTGQELETRLADAELELERAEAALEAAELRLVAAEAEIDQASDWIAETGAQLAANLAQAVLDLQAAQADVDALRDVTLPALAAELEASEVKITEVRDVILPALQDQLAASETKITELETVTLPALQTELDAALASVTEWQDTTYPALLTRLGENETALTTLVETTLPALDTRLGENEAAVTAANAAFDIAFPSGPINVSDAIIASANGKNSVSYTNVTAANKPGAAPTVASGSGRAVNDIHRNRNTSTGEVYAEWRWGGSAWQAVNYGDEILRSLDVGKLSAGTADIHTAVISKMAVQAATIIQLDATRITTGTLNTDRLNANQIAAKVATVIQLNADRITSGTIDTARLNATEIAAQVATVIQLNANRITAGTINTDRLNTNQIAAAVATVIELNASRITAGTINTDRLNTNQIAAKVATVIELNATRITTGTLNTDRLNANQVAAAVGSFLRLTADNLYIPGTATIHSSIVNEMWAQVVRSRKITTDMLVVGSGINLVVDPNFDDPELTSYRATLSNGLWTMLPPSPHGGTSRFRLTNASTGVETLELRPDSSGGFPDIDPGEQYRIRFRAVMQSSGAATIRPAIRYRRGDGTLAYVGVGGYKPIETDLTKIASAWHEVTWTAPDDATEAVLTLQINGAASFVDVVSPSMTVSGASLIVDGTISSRHINVTGELTARIASIMNLDVENLTATGTSTLKTAVIDNLWTNVVRARKITTDMLVVGSGENLVENPYFYDDGAGWGQASTLTYRTNGGYAGVASVEIAASSGQLGTYLGTAETDYRSHVDPGEWYRFSAYAMCPTGSIGLNRAAIFVRWYASTGGFLSISSFTNDKVIAANVHGRVESTMQAPANAAYASVGLYSQAAHNAPLRWSHPYLVKASSASMIVDGAIAARHITAESITGEKIAALTIEANNIKAGAITTAKLQATAIDGMTITGAHIRTSAAPWSGGGIRMLGPRFTMWDSTNRQRVDFNPDSNNFTVTGILEATNASGQGIEVRPPTTVYGGWLHFTDPTLNTGAYIATGGTSAVSTERGTLTMVSAATTANQRRGRIRLEPNGGVMIGAAPLGTASAERQYLNMIPNGHIRFFNDDTNVGIQMGSAGSTGVQMQASGSTQLWVQTDMFRAPSIWNNTSSGTANIAIYSNNGGEVRRVTSLSKYKLDQRGLDPQDAADAFLALDPVSWIDRGEHDRGEDPRRYLGFIAEQVAEVEKNYGLEGMTVYDEDGELASVSYDRLLALAVHAIRILNTRVEQLEER